MKIDLAALGVAKALTGKVRKSKTYRDAKYYTLSLAILATISAIRTWDLCDKTSV